MRSVARILAPKVWSTPSLTLLQGSLTDKPECFVNPDRRAHLARFFGVDPAVLNHNTSLSGGRTYAAGVGAAAAAAADSGGAGHQWNCHMHCHLQKPASYCRMEGTPAWPAPEPLPLQRLNLGGAQRSMHLVHAFAIFRGLQVGAGVHTCVASVGAAAAEPGGAAARRHRGRLHPRRRRKGWPQVHAGRAARGSTRACIHCMRMDEIKE